MKILLVDDEKDLVSTLTTILEKWGHSVLSAYDGIGAQKILQETTVDVILSDLIMPNMDGGELLTWLNAQEKKPHFIIMSAYYNDGFIKYFTDQGITNILGKPIQFDKLKLMLKKLAAAEEPEAAETPPHQNGTHTVPAEHRETKTDMQYEHLAKDITERLPEARHIIFADPVTGRIYYKVSKAQDFNEPEFSRIAAPLYLAAGKVWTSICGEKSSPKELLTLDDSNRMVYRSLVSPNLMIYIDATTQITHGLLRITIENVLKESTVPIS
ncbi:MAG: response regulator [Bacteroidota bacterium]